MPSPVGHSLAGIAAGWAVGRPVRLSKALAAQGAVLAAIGMAPDLDLLWGRHSRETHSLGAAMLVAAVASWRRWPVGPRSRARIFVAVLATWFLHPVMDAFSVDHAPPIGVMMWWPFSMRFVHASHPFFDPISRAWGSRDMWAHNLIAAMHEAALLIPIVMLVWWVRAKIRTEP